MVALLPVASLPAIAQTVPFDISITNTLPQTTYPWSAGLLTLSPVLPLGASPQPGTPAYAAYSFANSNCDYDDTFCSGTCNDNGNAVVLAQRLGLTLGVNAWLVPALNGNNTTATVHIEVPRGAKLSFIAWINNTSVFDDFVAMHVLGNVTDLSVPLFDAQGNPLNNVVFGVDGYDVNSTSATDGSGPTCSQECPAQTTGCFVTWGNASASTYPAQPTTAVTPLQLTAAGPTSVTTPQQTYTFTYRNTTGAQITGTTLKYTLPAGVTYVSSTNGGTYSATTNTVTWTIGTLANNAAAASRSVTVNLGAFGATTQHQVVASYTRSSRAYVVASNVITTVLATQPLTPAWTYTEPSGRNTDGIALSDFTSATRNDLALVAPRRGTATSGAVVIINSATGAQLSSFVVPGTNRTAMGFPLAADLGTTARDEVVFGEGTSAATDAGAFARNGDSSGRWVSTPYGYPGYWNMGPSSDGTSLFIADWDGDLRRLSTAGAVQASANQWNSDNEHPWGHSAIADVNGDGTNDMVLWGYQRGTVQVLNASTLATVWRSASMMAAATDGAYASGPAIGDIDGDGKVEIVVAAYGLSSDIYAFDARQASGSTCKYRFHPGGAYFYTSPVIGDVDGSGRKSIVAISTTNSVVSILKAGAQGCTAGGTTVWQYQIKNEGSSFAPVLYDVNGDGTLDVIAASMTKLVVLDVRNKTVLLSFEDPTATFSPSAVIGDADGDGVRELFVSGWRNSKVYRLNLPAKATSTNDWPTFMGNNARTGAR